MANIVFCDLDARMYVGTTRNIPKISGIFQGIENRNCLAYT